MRQTLRIDAPQLEARSRLRPVHVARIAAWVLVPLASATWIVATSDRYYFVWDEWAVISRGLSATWLEKLLVGFNGHMWTVPNFAYGIQTDVIGLESNWFIPALLALSLIAVQIGVAAVLVRLAVPLPIALAAATVVTFFGPGSETMVYQQMFGYNLAVAASLGAAFTALGKPVDVRRTVGVSCLLLVALMSESAAAAAGLLLVAVVLGFTWPFRPALSALAFPVVAHVAYVLIDRSEVLVQDPCPNCRSVRFGAPISDSLQFGWAVIVRSAGGLVAGGPIAGTLLLLIATICVGVGLLLRRLPRDVTAILVGAVAGAVLTAALLAYSRTGFWPTVSEAIATLDGPFNRYVQLPVVFLAVGFVPAIWWTVRPSKRAKAPIVLCATLALALVFAANLGKVDRTRQAYIGWSSSVEGQLRQAVSVVTAGCGTGFDLNPSSQPIDLSFQISVATIQELVVQGALSREFGTPPPSEMYAKICQPTN